MLTWSGHPIGNASGNPRRRRSRRRPGTRRRTPLRAQLIVPLAIPMASGLALGVDVPASYYWIVVPVVSLLTLFPVSLNGMGVREWGVVLLLAPLGVAAESATALAFLWFLTFTSVSLFGAFFYLFGRFPRFEVRPDDQPVRRDTDQGREGQHNAAA